MTKKKKAIPTKTIRISYPVWEAMVKEGKFGETPDDYLRRKFGLKEAS